MTLKQYASHLSYMLGQHGFIENPLNPDQIEKCYNAGLDIDSAYGIACDVSCGFPFLSSFNLVKEESI